MDDLLSGGATVEETRKLKEQAIEIFEDATFTLQNLKWLLNEPKLEESNAPSLEKEETLSFAKQQLGEP